MIYKSDVVRLNELEFRHLVIKTLNRYYDVEGLSEKLEELNKELYSEYQGWFNKVLQKGYSVYLLKEQRAKYPVKLNRQKEIIKEYTGYEFTLEGLLKWIKHT